jgi:hypothetical protein
MDVQAQGLGSGAWRDEELHRSAEAGTVQEVGLACMLPGLGKGVRTSVSNKAGRDIRGI